MIEPNDQVSRAVSATKPCAHVFVIPTRPCDIPVCMSMS